MNPTERLYHLFTRHLRILYNGEVKLQEAFTHLYALAPSAELEEFLAMHLRAKNEIVQWLGKCFHEMDLPPAGESDAIVASYINSNTGRKEFADAALQLFDETLGDYLVNAYRTAISCADDLDLPVVTAALLEALRITKFYRNDLVPLRQLLVAAKVMPHAA